MAESITVTDNRTGEVVEIPILDGGVSADDFRKLLPGIWFYDPAFMTTALTSSSITYLDGDAGILRYRGYPIEQLAKDAGLDPRVAQQVLRTIIDGFTLLEVEELGPDLEDS